jgi:hypothetical protein
MSTERLSAQQAADLNVRGWAVRTIGYGVIMLAGCAWLVRDEQPFWPAFALQGAAGLFFSLLILASIALGIGLGVLVGRLNGFLGFIVGLVAGAAFFFVVGLLSTEIPMLGPAIERIVSLIE